jgi:succinyl-CoA synthetase alpha subunit
MLEVKHFVQKNNIYLIGPNSPGIISSSKAKVGIIPGSITFQGQVGVISRSGTLTYEVVYALKQAGIGTSTCVGIGGDPIIGTNYIDILKHFEGDTQTDRIVLIGEIGGREEENAAKFIASHMTKPIVAFIAGRAAPPNKRMGHAGAIIEGGVGTAEIKIKSLEENGILVARYPEEIPDLLNQL